MAGYQPERRAPAGARAVIRPQQAEADAETETEERQQPPRFKITHWPLLIGVRVRSTTPGAFSVGALRQTHGLFRQEHSWSCTLRSLPFAQFALIER